MNKTIRNIIIVSIFAVGGGWLGVLVNNLTGQPQSLESLGALVWLVSPALVGILLRAFGGDGWKDVGFGLKLRAGWRWYLLSIFVYPLIMLLTFGVAAAFGAISTPGFAQKGITAFIAAAFMGVAGSMVKNIFEEFAWRGYLTPRLDVASVHPLLNHFWVGVIWWAWHLPYYYFLLDRAQLEPFLTADLNTFIITAFFVMFPTAILFGELRLLSKSVWPAFIFHCVINGFSLPLLLDGFIELNGLPGTILSPTNEGILVSILFGLVGLFLYRYRMSRDNR